MRAKEMKGAPLLLLVVGLAACATAAPAVKEEAAATEETEAEAVVEAEGKRAIPPSEQGDVPIGVDMSALRTTVAETKKGVLACSWRSSGIPSFLCKPYRGWLDLPYDAAHASIYMEMVTSTDERERVLGALKLETPLSQTSVLSEDEFESLFAAMEAERDPAAAEALGAAVSSQELAQGDRAARVIEQIGIHPVERARAGLMTYVLKRAPSDEHYAFVMKTIADTSSEELLEASLTSLNHFGASTPEQRVEICQTWLDVMKRERAPKSNLGAFYLTFASNYECPEQVAGAMDHVEARAAAKQPTDTYDITVLTVMAESEDPTLVERAIASFRLIAQTPASGFTRVEALMELEKHDPDILEFVESCVDDPEEYVAEECQRIRSEKQ